MEPNSHRLEVVVNGLSHEEALAFASQIAKLGLAVERVQVWRATQVDAWVKDGQIVVAGQAVEQDTARSAGG
jgi:hypothetical protein